MTFRLWTLFSLLVHVGFTKSGANQNSEANKIDDEETKRTHPDENRINFEYSKLPEGLGCLKLPGLDTEFKQHLQKINAQLNFDKAQMRKQLEGRDVELVQMKRELKESERKRELLKKTISSFEEKVSSQSNEAKRQSYSAGEITSRCAVEKEQLETRIRISDERLSKQILENKQMEIKLKNYKQGMEAMSLSNDILRRQLAETKQDVSLPDSPTHEQVGGTCMNYATATWIRKTLTEQFLRDLPRHHEIVESLLKSYKTRQEQFESIKKEAERWNLQVERLDLRKEGVFERAHKLLEDGHPIYVALEQSNWGALRKYCRMSLAGYLELQKWKPDDYDIGREAHSMVVTEYISPNDGKPGLYKIKNSHGEDGGSFMQNGYILIEDKVLRAMHVGYALIASKIEWKEEALRLRTQWKEDALRLTTQMQDFAKATIHAVESLKMKAKFDIENLKKQLAEAKQNICSSDSPLRKQCGPASSSVAFSIWAESSESLRKGKEPGNLRIIQFTKKEDFDRAHNFLKDGYPLFLRLKRGDWDLIQKYTDERSREYLSSDDWEMRRYRSEGGVLVVTEYIEPKDGKPGLYRIKTLRGEYADEPGQKEYILIEEDMLRDFNMASVSVMIPAEEARDIERARGVGM